MDLPLDNHGVPVLRRSSVGLVAPGERLRNGIWPTNPVVWMAAIYLALFIIRPWEQLFPWLQVVRFERSYAIAMIAVLLFTRGITFRFDSPTLAVLSLFAAIGVSYACAWNPALGWNSFYTYLTFVVFYFVLVSAIRTRYEFVFVVASYIVTMAVYLAKAQWEYFVHGQHRYDQGVIRMVGIESTFGGPNSLAMSIVASLPMVLFLYRTRDEFTLHWPDVYRKWFTRGLLIYAYLAISSLVLTNSRSGMVCFVVFVLLATLYGGQILRMLKIAFFAVLFLACIWSFVPEENKGRFRTIWDPESGPANAQASAEGRWSGYEAGISMFRESPITGVGVGNFVEYRIHFGDGIPLQAHNLIGQLLGETGVVGLAAFSFLFGATGWVAQTIKSRGEPRDPPRRVFHEFGISVQMALLLLFLDGLFAHNLYRYNWLWLAAFTSLAHFFSQQLAREAQ